MKADRVPSLQPWGTRSNSLWLPRRGVPLQNPQWRAPTELRRLFVVSQSEQERERVGSARERLRANPAYQRLKKASWKDAYKPADADSTPGPIPKHLLEVAGGSQQSQAKGSITKQWQGGQQQPNNWSAQAGAQQTQPPQGPQPTAQGGQNAQPRASALERTKQQQRGLSQSQRNVRMSRVRFWLQFHAEFGQRMRIVGSHENLGQWALTGGVELRWSPNDMWNAIIELPAGAIVEYKYVLLENDGTRAVAWQRGNNSVLAVGHADDEVEVFDNWESSPGASVVAAGATTTREGRLLSWASEIESLFSAQRSELRKSRMELAEAQEEARLAREEARRFRAELRASEAQRVKAEMKLKELTSANRLLKTQLADTTLSFRNALETTHRFLLEAEEAMASQKDSRGGEPGSPVASPSSSNGAGEVPASTSGQLPEELALPREGAEASSARSRSARSAAAPVKQRRSQPRKKGAAGKVGDAAASNKKRQQPRLEVQSGGVATAQNGSPLRGRQPKTDLSVAHKGVVRGPFEVAAPSTVWTPEKRGSRSA